MQQQQRTNLLQIATRKQSTLSPNEDQQYCIRNAAINIQSDSIVRQTNEVHLLQSRKFLLQEYLNNMALFRTDVSSSKEGKGMSSVIGCDFMRFYSGTDDRAYFNFGF